ncbi:unnamed protein product [Paramecium sonneborni]|uniref:Uncharacterized protein n=1 Tax=Paramecium sonneborni TaxID=65129 RepID=A0A8S1MDU6_9CILI|nr:unnamed protein product [Paramecium sonneborni]
MVIVIKFTQFSFLPLERLLSLGSGDNPICQWEIQKGIQIETSNKKYKEIITQFKIQLLLNNPIAQLISNMTILLTSQGPYFKLRRLQLQKENQ